MTATLQPVALKSKITAQPLESGDEVSLVQGGLEYFVLLKELISKALESIYLQTYIFEEDQIGNEIGEELIEASHRGVQVFLLVDGYASGRLSAAFIKRMRDSGIHFRKFNPLLRSEHFYFGRRLHHKVVTVDEHHALVGGINISDRYNDWPWQPAWLDWAVYAKGDVAVWLTHICKQRMMPPSQKALVKAKKYFSGLETKKFVPEANKTVAVKINDWVSGKREITATYMAMFRQATQSITIMSAYFLPNGLFRRAMKRAAARGVKVKLILAGSSDVLTAKYAERYMYRWLLKNNIEIYEYQKSVLHGKMAVYDDKWATVGSYNVNSISAYASIELNLAISDPSFAKQASIALKKIIEFDCLRVTKVQYGLAERILQQGAYYVFRVLFFLFTFYFKRRQ
jgi:cardiolipin synthase A/B